MTQTLTQLAAADAAANRAAFVAAAWKREKPRELLRLAAAAGLPAQEADVIQSRVEGLRSVEAEAAKLTTLEAAAVKAQAQFEKTRAKLQAEIDQLESRIVEAAYVVDDANRAARDAGAAKNALLVAFNQGLVPGDNETIVAIQAKEAQYIAAVEANKRAHLRLAAAVARVKRCDEVRDGWEKRRDYMLVHHLEGADYNGTTWTLARCNEQIAKYPAELAKAKEELREAIAAAKKAGVFVSQADNELAAG